MIAFALIVMSIPEIVSLFAPPANNPICNGGLQDSGPGGMFGYRVALSSGENSLYTWMVTSLN